MRTLSALLFLAVAGLVAAGVIKIRHDYLLTGTELIGWAFVPLALLLGFTWPVRCRVKTTSRKACGNWAYGFLFGCTKAAGHWTGKFLVRLGLKGDEAKPVESRKPAGSYAFNQPVPQSKPPKMTVEDSRLSVCASWAGVVSAVVAVIQAIIYFAHLDNDISEQVAIRYVFNQGGYCFLPRLKLPLLCLRKLDTTLGL
jgi:hypothetical protein